MNTVVRRQLAFLLAQAIAIPAIAGDLVRPGRAPFRVENQVIATSGDKYFYLQSRAALIPGNPPRVIVTAQETERVGAHGYRDMYFSETTDLGRTWSGLAPIEALRRKRLPDGYDFVMGDVCPKWHAATGVVLATGKTFGFKDGVKEDRSRERISYSVYRPDTRTWSGLQLLELPQADHEGKPILEPNSGCHQRFDLPNGDILLPIRYRKDSKTRYYTTIVALCRFDGKTLTYVKHGSEFTIPRQRGLYEPSIGEFQGRSFLTMRADHSAFVARSDDGLNYEPFSEWKFDDGELLGSYNTQQHWIAHSDALYLAYTRRGANNDHVFRHRAPIFIARVDPEKLCVIRATEQVLIPENGLDLGAGFYPVDINPNETWVVTSEGGFPKERLSEPNHILLAKIFWSKPNQRPTANLISPKK